MRLLRALGATGLALVVLLPVSAAAQTYDEALQLSWDADGPHSAELLVPVFPGPRVVPGDVAARSFVVRNDGPGEGLLTVEIVNVELAGDPTDDFYSDFRLNGEPVTSFHGHDTLVLERIVDAGEVTTVDLDYGFPHEATSGNHAVEGTVQVEFDLQLRIEGDTPLAITDTPPPGSTPPGLPRTGAPVLGSVLGACVALVIGAALTRRRSRT